MGAISNHASLITPDQRLSMVPVECGDSSQALGWNRVRVEDYPTLPESDIKLPGMDHHLLVYHYKALDGVFYHECAGRKTQTVLQDGQLSFIPAGADNRWLFGRGDPSALHLMVHRDQFDSIVERDTGTAAGRDLKDDFQVTSPQLEAIAKLFSLALANGQGTRLYIDTLATALACRINQEFSDCTTGPVHPHRKDVSRAHDLIHDALCRQISLSELAELCDMSRSQLVRSFKKQYGHAPHQYLTLCRIDRAKQMLRQESTLSIANLAIDLGFADQSHLTRHFKSVTGLTPREFRMQSLA